jgi:hypothetical protein
VTIAGANFTGATNVIFRSASGKTLIPGVAIGAIFDLQMLDAQHGFAVDGGGNSITGPPQIRGVLATVDGGEDLGSGTAAGGRHGRIGVASWRQLAVR